MADLLHATPKLLSRQALFGNREVVTLVMAPCTISVVRCTMLDWVKIAVCDVCGHRWIPEGDKEPVRCPRRRCRSVAWNRKPIVMKPRAEGITDLAVGVGDTCALPARPTRTPRGIILPPSTPAVAIAAAHPRPSHDPATCTLYKCGMCAAAKM